LENRESHSSEGGYGEGRGAGYRSDRAYGGYGGRGRGGFAGPRPFRPSPVKVGEEFDVRIESMSKRGDAGVAKVEGLVIFVTGTKVGDNVRIRITKVGRGYATAEVARESVSTEQTAEDEAGAQQSSTTDEAGAQQSSTTDEAGAQQSSTTDEAGAQQSSTTDEEELG
jgi:predicted RNA-binding protein with TRAM domain